jgi:tetratricopeptide (TPR) repeat protein
MAGMEMELEEAVAAIYSSRNRNRMQPTIEAFRQLVSQHPHEAQLVYELAGAFDTAGEEAAARPLYEQALTMGLAGDALRRCLLQYGSTLRNLGELEGSIRALDRAAEEFPGSVSVAVFRSLTLLESGRCDAAVGTLLQVIAAHAAGDLDRYLAAASGNATFLLERDRQPGSTDLDRG